MIESRIELLVLDAHGVVLNAYWPSFLREVARRTHVQHEQIVHRWQNAVRADAWSGRIDDEELWQRLTGTQASSIDWRSILEAGYTYGPAAPHLQSWSKRVPIYLLSNHRSHWLLPRLDRFGLRGFFDRILISDSIGAVKPQAASFAPILDYAAGAGRVLFIDDQLCNVESARTAGIQALHSADADDWPNQVCYHLGLEAEVRTLPPAFVGRAGSNEQAGRTT